MTIEELKAEVEKLKATQKHDCPYCGACQHCGRGGYQAMPVYPNYPFYPSPYYPPQITWTSDNMPNTSGTVFLGAHSVQQ